jgi:hypothetical protein
MLLTNQKTINYENLSKIEGTTPLFLFGKDSLWHCVITNKKPTLTLI